MTLQEMRASDKLLLTPVDVAPLLGVDPQSIRLQAQKDPDKLGFNVSVVGTRTLIPRLPFLQFLTQQRGTE